MLGLKAGLLLLLLLWTAQGRAVPGDSSPAWTQCQQLSQKLCTLAWSAHPQMGPMVSGSFWDQTGVSPSFKTAVGHSWP